MAENRTGDGRIYAHGYNNAGTRQQEVILYGPADDMRRVRPEVVMFTRKRVTAEAIAILLNADKEGPASG